MTENDGNNNVGSNGVQANTEKSNGHKDPKSTGPPEAIHSLIYDNVCHYPQESCFTKLSDTLKLDGFKNFVWLLLIIACGRLIFENLSMYGFAANPLRWISFAIEHGMNKIVLFYIIALNGSFIVSLVLEKCYIAYLYGNQRATKLSNGTSKFGTTDRGENIFRAICLAFLFVLLAIPIVLNRLHPVNPYLMTTICLAHVYTFLKLYSYHQVNSWWRTGVMYGKRLEEMPNLKRLEANMEKYITESLHHKKADQKELDLTFYPQNLTVSNVVYFSVVPTLCYQLNYPRTKSINYMFVLRCLLEAVLLIELATVLAEQWVVVPLDSQKFMLSQLSVSQFLLKWTKLSLGTISIWLIGFYLLFQSLSNLVAELFQFADRDFYRDWWNAKSISEFWRNWNLPVHRWCVRHLFKPMIIQGGFSVTATSFAVFIFSGLLHEYVISVSVSMCCVHFLLGMTLQQPLDMATANVHKSSPRLANSIVWLSLILGQSILILMYYNDLIIRMRVQAAEAAASLMI